MNQPFEQIGFLLELTKDGSPTLRSTDTQNQPESMHHSGGAAAETNFIYQSVIQKALRVMRHHQPSASFRTAVVGLGLGYIEICWMQTLLKHQLQATREITIDSFEIIEGLKDLFIKWAQGADVVKTYDEISYQLNSSIPANQVRTSLGLAFENGSQLRSDVRKPTCDRQWNVICFDAFSQQKTDSLWSKDFLNYFLDRQAAVDCVFTTYASTGPLKKALAEQGFQLVKRPGFHGKRESTVALRGLFKEELMSWQTF